MNNVSSEVIVVDSHPDFLKQLCAVVQAAGNLKLLATARNLDSVMWLLKTLEPQYLLLDPALPDARGIEAITLIHAVHPDMALIALSMHADGRYAAEALTAGCRGYVLKDCIHAELPAALSTVNSGRMYVSRNVGLVAHDAGRKLDAPDREENRRLLPDKSVEGVSDESD